MVNKLESFLLHERRGSAMLSMQDISNWQGPKAPEMVQKHEILAIKATEGNNFLDPMFPENWDFAARSEKARVAYHFLHPSIPGPQQAQFFLNYIKKYDLHTGDMLAVDLEVTDGMDPAAVDECARQFCDTVASDTKANPFVYTYIYFAQSGNCASLASRPLWIADPSHAPAKPDVPHPWENWLIHQYGVFRGIDADVVNVDSVDKLAQYGALVGPPAPPPNTTVMTLTDGGAVMRRDLNDKTPVEALKGQKFQAGGAEVRFE